MMKNKFNIFFLLFSGLFFSQSKQSLNTIALHNNNVDKVVNLMKDTPRNYSNNNSSLVTKKENNSMSTKNIQNAINHLFNNDPSNPEAFLQIQNQSDCDIKVKIEGKKVYYMDVSSMGENFILIPKGKYSISTQMCKAQYSSFKDLNKDMMIKLVANKNARN